MSTWWAAETIDSLASLPGFPGEREKTARETLARQLEKIFEHPSPVPAEQELEAARLASQLVEKMMSYDRWPGPGAFFAVARSIRFPNAGEYSIADIPHLSKYLPPAPGPGELCDKCDGFGYVQAGGLYQRCDCPQGEQLGETFLDMLNARTAKVRGPGTLKRATVSEQNTVHYEPVTEADVQNAVHARRVERALNDPDFSTGGNQNAGN